jgi:hypothetical protein
VAVAPAAAVNVSTRDRTMSARGGVRSASVTNDLPRDGAAGHTETVAGRPKNDWGALRVRAPGVLSVNCTADLR